MELLDVDYKSDGKLLNLRGTWLAHIIIVVALKVIFSSVPGISPEASWTLTNVTYNLVYLPHTLECL